jgi:hypothetical protein
MPNIVKSVGADGVTLEPALASFLGDLAYRDRMSDDQKWRFAGQNALQASSVGFLAGTVVAMITCRSPAARSACAAFGAAFGLGRAYVDARFVFGHDVKASAEWLAVAGSPAAAPKAQ